MLKMPPKSNYNQYLYCKQPIMNLKNIYRNRYDKPPVSLKMRRKYLRSRETPATCKTLSCTLLKNNDYKHSKGDSVSKGKPMNDSKPKNNRNKISTSNDNNMENMIFDELNKITKQFNWVKNVYKQIKINKNKIEKIYIENKVVQTGGSLTDMTRKLIKTIKKSNINLSDNKLLKNKKIINSLLKISAKDQTANYKLLKQLIKITNKTLFEPIKTEITVLRKENCFLKEDFDAKLNVFHEKIEQMQSIQNEYLNLIFSKTLQSTETSNKKTFEKGNLDVKDDFDYDLMNDVRENYFKKESKYLLNTSKNIKYPMDVLVYQKKFAGKSESAPSSVRRYDDYHGNQHIDSVNYDILNKRRYCLKHANRDSLTHISTSVYTSDDSSISFCDGEPFGNSYLNLQKPNSPVMLCNKQINNSPVASLRGSVVGLNGGCGICDISPNIQKNPHLQNKQQQQQLQQQQQQQQQHQQYQFQQQQQQHFQKNNSYNGFKNKANCINSNNNSNNNNNNNPNSYKRNLQNNVTSSISIGSSEHSELKLSSPSKASRSSSRNSNKSYSLNSSKMESSFAKKSPERIKSKSTFLRLICCTSN